MEFFKDEAIEASKKSYCHFQHGAIVIRKGRIISSSCNDDHNHAEINAILKVLIKENSRKDRENKKIFREM